MLPASRWTFSLRRGKRASYGCIKAAYWNTAATCARVLHSSPWLILLPAGLFGKWLRLPRSSLLRRRAKLAVGWTSEQCTGSLVHLETPMMGPTI